MNDKIIVLGHTKFAAKTGKTYYKVFFGAKLSDKISENVSGYEVGDDIVSEDIYNVFSKSKLYTELEGIVIRKFTKDNQIKLSINRLL